MHTTVIPTTATASTVPKGNFRVLVVDDSQGDMALTSHQLGAVWPFEHDLAVEWAVDGAQAIDKLRRERFALLVLDWQLPTVSGAEVLRHVRRSGVRIPVIVVSGLQREEIHENLESHAAAFLNKDEMNVDTFHQAIAQSLRLLGHLPT